MDSSPVTTISNLLDQLSQLSASLKQTNSYISDLARLSFSPVSEPVAQTNAVRIDLVQDIQDLLRQHDAEFDLLKQDAEVLSDGRRRAHANSERERERARLAAQVSRLDEDLRRARSAFRRAQLIAKRTGDAARIRERESSFATLIAEPQEGQLPSSNTSKRPQKQKLTKEEVRAATQSDVVAGLRRTYNQLATEVTRSRFAQETLDESSAALARLGDQYEGLGSVLGKSRKLLGTLLRSQKSDTWYLETAFYILFATLAWLVFRRLLYGPFIKLPLFFYRLAFFVLNWTILKPIWLFATVTGILRSVPVEHQDAAITTTSRPPLIIKPSATGRAQVIPMADRERLRNALSAGVPAGAGGGNAKASILDGPLSEQIGRMAEESQGNQQQQQDDDGIERDENGEEIVRRGDGAILPKRGEEQKPNPKKQMFDAKVEDAKHEAKQRQRHEEL